jgi:predicted PurR-regulated permease PerM
LFVLVLVIVIVIVIVIEDIQQHVQALVEQSTEIKEGLFDRSAIGHSLDYKHEQEQERRGAVPNPAG